MPEIPSHEITPEHLYLSRRKFLIGAGALVALALVPSACRRVATTASGTPPASSAAASFCEGAVASAGADELGAKLTTCEDVTSYNNFYEFSYDKEGVAYAARGFKSSPWTVTVGGLVNKPRTFAMEDILSKFTQQERIYRLRCVEGWSMVIPWSGFPLSQLLTEVEPMSAAKYVRFESLYDPQQMQNQNDNLLVWPYVEGLRLDEATHNLTILATGLYGKPLPAQDGAPIRLVVPWKYGFKNIKSIVKIDLVADMPTSTWTLQSPGEYGFYANVNPDVDHPRWSQASERRIGELSRVKTLLFNGYGGEVAGLYAGLDLRTNY